jgi:hypothetical protein
VLKINLAATPAEEVAEVLRALEGGIASQPDALD